MDDNEDRLWKIFAPEIARRVEEARTSKVRFAHYTSAESAMKILDTGRMILRCSKLMNDFSEVEYGYKCLNYALNSGIGKRLEKVMMEVQGDLPLVFSQNFQASHFGLFNQTYLLSVAEHHPGSEDEFGKLSMWRAYARRDGVAFVLNSNPFVSDSNSLNAFTAPVLYKTPDEIIPYVEEIATAIEQNLDFVKSYGGKFFHDILTRTFQTMIQTTKHPAFEEEQEWRVIYSPMLIPDDERFEDQDTRVPSEILTIRGVPQQVYAIPFKDYPDEGFTGATVPDLLDRLLIGPSADAESIAHAFFEKLRSGYGIEVPKITLTGIPLRI